MLNCPRCNQPKVAVVIEKSIFSLVLMNVYLVQCLGCGLILGYSYKDPTEALNKISELSKVKDCESPDKCTCGGDKQIPTKEEVNMVKEIINRSDTPKALLRNMGIEI